MSEREYSPWIKHDGKGYPHDLVRAGRRKMGWQGVTVAVDPESGHRCLTPLEEASGGCDVANPAWSWRWKGGFLTKRRRVSIDPDYMPIIRFRFWREKPPAAERSAGVELLRAIAEGRRVPEEEPVPVLAPEADT